MSEPVAEAPVEEAAAQISAADAAPKKKKKGDKQKAQAPAEEVHGCSSNERRDSGQGEAADDVEAKRPRTDEQLPEMLSASGNSPLHSFMT